MTQSDSNREYAKAVRILRTAYIFAIMNIIMFIFLVMTAFKAIKYGETTASDDPLVYNGVSKINEIIGLCSFG